MNGSFQSTDIYLTNQESTFCHFLSFIHTKKFVVTLKKCFYIENKANFEHFAENTLIEK